MTLTSWAEKRNNSCVPVVLLQHKNSNHIKTVYSGQSKCFILERQGSLNHVNGLQLSVSDIKTVSVMHQKLSSIFCQQASRQYLVIGQFSISQSISLPTGFLLMFGSNPAQETQICPKLHPKHYKLSVCWRWPKQEHQKRQRWNKKKEIKTGAADSCT